MPRLPKVCIIGAGSSGLTTIKSFRERGIPHDCFDRSDDLGGNWYYNNPNGLSSAYRLLHIDTSKSRMEYSDYSMSEAWPNYCHHTQVLEYFRGYAERFGLRDSITFNIAVERAELTADLLWRIRLSNGDERLYDALVVCNGHHWDPRWPQPPFPGNFADRVMHSHDYRDAEEFRGQRVLLLGMGNSAMDIAVECSYVADKVYLAARRGAHIIPKYLWGRPVDQWRMPGIPWKIQRLFLRAMLAVQSGPMTRYGLPEPDHGLFEAHPSVSSVILDRISHGDIVPKPNIERLAGERVEFVDGTSEAIDTIIYCTGYKVSFPFFDSRFLSAPDNDLPLFLRTFRPDIPSLAFVGLMQPLGAIFPLAEQQAILIGEYLAGRYAWPAHEEMIEQMRRERTKMFHRYVKSQRHTMQVDFDVFLRQIRRELKAGGVRAAQQSHALPVPARVETLAS